MRERRKGERERRVQGEKEGKLREEGREREEREGKGVWRKEGRERERERKGREKECGGRGGHSQIIRGKRGDGTVDDKRRKRREIHDLISKVNVIITGALV